MQSSHLRPDILSNLIQSSFREKKVCACRPMLSNLFYVQLVKNRTVITKFLIMPFSPYTDYSSPFCLHTLFSKILGRQSTFFRMWPDFSSYRKLVELLFSYFGLRSLDIRVECSARVLNWKAASFLEQNLILFLRDCRRNLVLSYNGMSVFCHKYVCTPHTCKIIAFLRDVTCPFFIVEGKL